jgi:hypothetical protein
VTAFVALLPDWYVLAYAREGRVCFLDSLRASASAFLRAILQADPVHLECLNLLSLATFVLFIAHHGGPTAVREGLIRIAPGGVWISISVALFLIQAAAALSWSRRADNRSAALALCGGWWFLLSGITYAYGGLLAVHISQPWLALTCIIASVWQQRGQDGPQGH